MTDSLVLHVPESPDVVNIDGEAYLRVVNPPGRPAMYYLPPVPREFGRIDCILMDMDGSSTDTEKLVVRSLRDTMREILQDPDFDTNEEDYRHIVGDSTTNHLVYLISRYGRRIDDRRLAASFLRSLRRHSSVHTGLELMAQGFLSGDRKIFDDPELRELLSPETTPLESADNKAFGLVDRYNLRVDRVQGAAEIYYADYHAVLLGVRDGVIRDTLVEPMPFLAQFLKTCRKLGIKLALVTSSNEKEVQIIMPVVFQAMGFVESFEDFYDTIVTASNNEMENYLKPHPMLYDMALTKMGYQQQTQRSGCFGVEDSAFGLKALRAAGISAVAVTHPGTKNHDKSFANLGTARLDGEERGGLRDIMVRSRLFLKEGSEQRARLDEELAKL